jgi:subtilase family serine protease
VKRLLILVTVIALVMLAVVPLSFSTHAAPRASRGLQFVPMIEVAPDDSTQGTSTTPACTSPDPIHTSDFFHCYTPAQMAAAYGVDTLHGEGITGKGQTIVIVDSYGSPTALSDLQFFSTTFGLPQPDLTIFYPNGKPTYSKSMHGIQAGWAEETSLDLQWAHAMAPDAKLVLIAANPAETEGVQGFPSMFKGEQYAIAHYPGSVISQSFAVTEQSFNAAAMQQVSLFDQVYQQAVANHITVVSASGDAGTANVDKQGRVYPFPTAQWPASDPLVTAAGGTWLQYGWTWNPASPTDLSFVPTPGSRTEPVWNEPFLPAATGGGRSVLYTTPSFQSGISQSLLNGRRGLPDLSWNAAVDGGALVYTSFGGVRVGWHIIGGTSASTPQLAAMVALTNQLADTNHTSHVGYLNPLLYGLPASDFNDIVPLTFGPGAVTLADNSLFGSGIAGMAVTTGYDLATGFGSPVAHSFVHDLAAVLP